jgi:hypothetical protein
MFSKHAKMATLDLNNPIQALAHGLPRPNPKPEERYRFYACELKWNAWSCSPTTQQTWDPSPGTITTTLVPIRKWTPQFLDPLILRYSVHKPVIVKPPPPQNQS